MLSSRERIIAIINCANYMSDIKSQLLAKKHLTAAAFLGMLHLEFEKTYLPAKLREAKIPSIKTSDEINASDLIGKFSVLDKMLQKLEEMTGISQKDTLEKVDDIREMIINSKTEREFFSMFSASLDVPEERLEPLMREAAAKVNQQDSQGQQLRPGPSDSHI